MEITVIGAGYVGLVTGACLAAAGHRVLCVETDAAKVATLNGGESTIHEQGLTELIGAGLVSGRLRFATAADAAHTAVQFIAVGTPQDEDGSADLQYVLAAARGIAAAMAAFQVVVLKSTVPVGTAALVRKAIQAELDRRGAALEFAIVSNPEFLREGTAVADFNHPERIVIGTESGAAGRRAAESMRDVYRPFNQPRDCTLWMDNRSAELTKYAANAMLATRISFMNELAVLAERVGADIELVRRGVGSDSRIGPAFLQAGCGFGGSCFPKDLLALERVAANAGQTLSLLRAVEAVNAAQKRLLGDKVKARLGDDLAGRRFALWGLAFKPGTDDMRQAVSLVLLRQLLAAGAQVTAYDPVAMTEARRLLARLPEFDGLLHGLHYAPSAFAAARDADALLIVTEWPQFRTADPATLKMQLRLPLVFDGRNLFDPSAMAAHGIEYHCIGRPTVPCRAPAPRMQPADLYTVDQHAVDHFAVDQLAVDQHAVDPHAVELHKTGLHRTDLHRADQHRADPRAAARPVPPQERLA